MAVPLALGHGPGLWPASRPRLCLRTWRNRFAKVRYPGSALFLQCRNRAEPDLVGAPRLASPGLLPQVVVAIFPTGKDRGNLPIGYLRGLLVHREIPGSIRFLLLISSNFTLGGESVIHWKRF